MEGWRLLGRMLAKSGRDELESAGVVLDEIAAAVPAFRGISYASLGDLGLPLAAV